MPPRSKVGKVVPGCRSGSGAPAGLCTQCTVYTVHTYTHTHQAFLTPACTVHRVRWNYDWASPGISCKNPCRLTMHKPLPSSHWPVPFRLCPVPCCLQGIRSPSSPFPDTFQAIVHAMSIAAGQKSPGRSSSSRSCSSRPRRSSGSPWCFVWHIAQKTQNKFVRHGLINTYICICNHERNKPSRLSTQWPCTNSCTSVKFEDSVFFRSLKWPLYIYNIYI